MKYEILQGDNRDTLKTIADNSIDAIVTDPPYGIDFLGKSWDANTGALETYQECLRVLKPGGHILAFSAARTYHHLAVTLEQAGFEIRDQIMWIYSSGFPKSQDVGRQIQKSLGVKEKTTIKGGARPSDLMVQAYAKENEYTQPVLTDPEAQKWSGWGTQLKPAHEPIVLARKPMKSSIAANCQEWGVGALNIEAGRIAMDPEEAAAYMEWMRKYPGSTGSKATFNNILSEAQGKERLNKGQAEILEDREELIQSRANGRFPSNVIGEIPDYQKYFYWPKVSRKERHTGFDDATVIGSTHPDDVRAHPLWDPSIGGNPARLKQKIIDSGTFKGNNHPTVKPIELMKYLIRLITPAGGHVLDPFNGSGSTGCAAVELDFAYTGIELDPKYIDISERRIESWYRHTHPNNFGDLFEVLD
jgi:site-specific DNA-methyltransferase (adenine-specific)